MNEHVNNQIKYSGLVITSHCIVFASLLVSFLLFYIFFSDLQIQWWCTHVMWNKVQHRCSFLFAFMLFEMVLCHRHRYLFLCIFAYCFSFYLVFICWSVVLLCVCVLSVAFFFVIKMVRSWVKNAPKSIGTARTGLSNAQPFQYQYWFWWNRGK